MEFSVIICMYNTSERDLLFTLDSVIKQRLESFEIIMADDGSENNHREFITDYFKQHAFEKYKLVMNKRNQGTIKNLLSGLQVAEGEFVKPIGAGDAFAYDTALAEVYEEMVLRKAKCLFCDLKIFSYVEDKIIYRDGLSIPKEKDCYKSGHSTEKSMENVIVYNDAISGASMFYDTNYFMDMLKIIESKVKYMEDLIQYLILLSGEKIYYLDSPCIMYEVGSGISTLNNQSNNIRMVTDKTAFLNLMFEMYPKVSVVRRRKYLEDVEVKYTNKLVKGLLKAIKEPKWLIFRMKRKKIS